MDTSVLSDVSKQTPKPIQAVEWMGRGMQRQQTLTLLRIPSLPSRKPSIEPEAAGSDSSNDEEEESTPQPSSRRSKQSKAEKKAQAEAAMNLILAERVKSMARVQAALLKCEDVVYGDYEAEKEVSDTIKNQVADLLFMHQDAQEIRDEELAALSQWFRIRTDLAKSDKDLRSGNSAIDIDEYSTDMVMSIIGQMTRMRGNLNDVSHKMVETAKSIVSNDTTKQLLKDQQDRFVSEVNSLVESLERVESHAKGLTQNNQELRRQLKLLEDDKETWRRRFLAVEHKEESMVRQMEAAIVARTEALQKTMSEQAGDAAEQIHSLMERIRALQGEVFQEQENVRKREQEVVAVQAEKSKVEERMQDMVGEMVDLRQAAGPTAGMISKLKKDLEQSHESEAGLRKELQQLRSSWNKAVPLPEPHTPSAATEPEIRRAPGPGPKEFKDESAQTQSDNSTLEQRLAELDKERQETKEKLSDLKIALAKAEHVIKKQDANLDELEQTKFENRKKISEMGAKLESQFQETQDLKAAAVDNSKKMSEHRATIQRQQKKIEEMLQTNDKQRQVIEQLSSQSPSSRGSLPVLKFEASETAPIIQDASESTKRLVNQLLKTVEDLEAEKAEREAQESVRKSEQEQEGGGGGPPMSPGSPSTDRISKAVSFIKNLPRAPSDRFFEDKAMQTDPQDPPPAPVQLPPPPSLEGDAAAEALAAVVGRVWRFHEEVVQAVLPTAVRPSLSPELAEQLLQLPAGALTPVSVSSAMDPSAPGTPGATDTPGRPIGTAVRPLIARPPLDAAFAVANADAFIASALASVEGYLTRAVAAPGVREVVQAVVQTNVRTEEIRQEEVALKMEQLVKTHRHVEMKRVIKKELKPPQVPRAIAAMEARHAQRQAKWEAKKARLKEERAQTIMQTMDAMLRVVNVNFKVPVRPGVYKSMRGVVYSSLLESAEPSQPQPVANMGRPGGQNMEVTSLSGPRTIHLSESARQPELFARPPKAAPVSVRLAQSLGEPLSRFSDSPRTRKAARFPSPPRSDLTTHRPYSNRYAPGTAPPSNPLSTSMPFTRGSIASGHGHGHGQQGMMSLTGGLTATSAASRASTKQPISPERAR